MKKLRAISLLLCIQFSYSQVQKGTIVIGGGINLNGNSGNSTNASNYDRNSSNGNFGISGSYEKFVSNITAVGISLGYTYYGSSSEFDYGNGTQEYGTRRNMIQIGPTVTRYISLREKLYLTVGGGFLVGFGTTKDIETDEKSKIWSLGLGVRPGVAFFLNDNFALSAGIGNLFYSFESEKSEESNVNGETPKDTRHNYGLSFSLNTFSVGLRYFLLPAKSE
jgi:hypothetical protein